MALTKQEFNTDFLTGKQQKFLKFCIEQHGDQKRKYTGEPYWYHLVNVAKIIHDAGHCDLIEIALGHDLLEDVEGLESETVFAELISIGYSETDSMFIVNGIIALTDIFTKEAYPDWNRKKRKAEESKRLGKISPSFQTVKYADLIDNGNDILKNDPKFAKVYLSEKQEILRFMDKGDKHLFNKAKEIALNIKS